MQHALVTLRDSQGKDLKKNLTWQKRIKSHADCIVPHWKLKVIVSSPSNKLGHPSRWSYFVLKITKSRCTQYFTLQSRGAWLSLHETSTTLASKGKQTSKQMQQQDTRPFTQCGTSHPLASWKWEKARDVNYTSPHRCTTQNDGRASFLWATKNECRVNYFTEPVWWEGLSQLRCFMVVWKSSVSRDMQVSRFIVLLLLEVVSSIKQVSARIPKQMKPSCLLFLSLLSASRFDWYWSLDSTVIKEDWQKYWWTYSRIISFLSFIGDITKNTKEKSHRKFLITTPFKFLIPNL